MSAKRSTQTRQQRPSVAALEKENRALRTELLALRAERDETDELVKFLRRRGHDLNASLRVARAQVESQQKQLDAAAPDAN